MLTLSERPRRPVRTRSRYPRQPGNVPPPRRCQCGPGGRRGRYHPRCGPVAVCRPRALPSLAPSADFHGSSRVDPSRVFPGAQLDNMSQGGQRKLAALALAYLIPTTNPVVLGRLTDLVSLWSSVLALTEESEGGECVVPSFPALALVVRPQRLTRVLTSQRRAVRQRRGGRRVRDAGRLPVGRRGRLHRDARDHPPRCRASRLSPAPLSLFDSPAPTTPQLSARDPIRTHPLKTTIGAKLSEAQRSTAARRRSRPTGSGG